MKKLFLLISILMISISTFAQISYIGDIGSNTIKNSSVADLVVTTTAAVAAGDDIIIAYGSDPSQDLNVSITDAAGNSYQQSTMAIMVGSMRAYIFAAYNVNALASGSSITITQTVYSTSNPVAARAAVVSVFRGLAPSGALEQSCVSSGTSTSPSSGAATTLTPIQLLVGAVGTEGPSTDNAGTWSNSFTAGPRAGTSATTGDAEITISMGYRIVSSAGSYTAAKTGITSRDWAAAIATFKPTSDGISYIGNIGGNWSKTSGTSLTITTYAPVAIGDDIILTFATDVPTSGSPSVSDAAGNTYNSILDVTNSGNVRTVVFSAYIINALPGGSTITISHPSVTARSAVACVFRGLASESQLDRTHTGTGSGGAASSGTTSSTTKAYELLIGAVGIEGPNVDAPSVWQNSFSYGPRLGTSFGASSGDATDITAQMGWRIVNATAAYTAQIISLNTSRDWAAAIATLKAEDDNPPLPVELSSFSAAVKNGTIVLSWTTATEKNNFGFDVEKSSGNVWSKIGFVQGSGNSNSVKDYSFSDKASAGIVSYRLKQIDNDGTYTYSKTIEVNVDKPNAIDLKQNYPNPFNPTTKISFALPQAGNVSLKVFNLLGQEVGTLVNGFTEAGTHSFDFNAEGLSNGMYVYQLNTDGITITKKMIFMK